jgi:hypothetical protein
MFEPFSLTWLAGRFKAGWRFGTRLDACGLILRQLAGMLVSLRSGTHAGTICLKGRST